MNLLSTCAAAAALLIPLGAADAYEVVPVQEGARVTGTVTLQGTPPKPPPATFPHDLAPDDRKFCSQRQPLVPPYYVVDPAGHLKDVVVWVEGVAKGKATTKVTSSLVNENCRFAPHVQALAVGSELQVENHDPILHNTHLDYADQSTLFNLALPTQGLKVKKKVRRAGIIKVKCDAGHTWMRAFVHAFDHPYFAVTGADGAFAIPDLPPGKYTLRAWHEAAGEQSIPLEVGPGARPEVKIAFKVR